MGMRYRPLGGSGLVVSVVGVGCNTLGRWVDVDGAVALVSAALESGITLFDTADVYGSRPGESEEVLGEALERLGARDEVVLATKFGNDMRGVNGPDRGARGSRRYIRAAVESSLRRLRVDHVDLYQYHRPDGITPVEETLAALDELVTAGLVRYAGSSNFDAWQVVEADWVARTEGRTRFVSAQNHYNLLHRGAENALAPACEAYGVGILPYFPLAYGLLTGKYRRGRPRPEGTRLDDPEAQAHWLTDEAMDRVEALAGFAEERGVTLLDVAIGGLAAQPAVASVIAGARSAAQVSDNARAGAWEPTVEDLAALDRLVPAPDPED